VSARCHRLTPYLLAVVVPAALVAAVKAPSRLRAQDLPLGCSATGVALSALSGSAWQNAAFQWQYAGSSAVTWGCTTGGGSLCRVCSRAETQTWNGSGWGGPGPSTKQTTDAAPCGSAGNSATLSVNVAPVFPGVRYRTTLAVKPYNVDPMVGLNPWGCDGDDVYPILTFQEYVPGG